MGQSEQSFLVMVTSWRTYNVILSMWHTKGHEKMRSPCLPFIRLQADGWRALASPGLVRLPQG